MENYGDLLFPLIFERRLSDIADNFVHVSPVGGHPAWEDCVSSVAFSELLRAPPDDLGGAVIGGGNIIHASPETVELYDSGGISSSLAYPSLWLGAGYLAARENLPLCWNGPGVPGSFAPIAARLLQWTASVSDYIALRDTMGQRLIEQTGVTQPMDVVPDTALDVSRLWTEETIDEAYEDAFIRRDMNIPGKSLVFHLNSRYVREGLDIIAARLDRICDNLKATPILIGLGPCHGDDDFQRQVAQEMTTEPLLIERPRSLREAAACIARSEAYIGSSMHGMITACSFGCPGMLVTSQRMPKFEGFLEHFNLSSWHTASWKEAERRADDLLSTPASMWQSVMETADPLLDEHWSRVRSALTSGTVSDKRPKIEHLRSIGAEYLVEPDVFGGIVVENLTSLQTRLQKSNAESRQKSRDIDMLVGWMEQTEHTVSALLNSKQWKIGHAIGEFRRKITRSPRVPTAADRLDDIMRQFQAWRGTEPVRSRKQAYSAAGQRKIEKSTKTSKLRASLSRRLEHLPDTRLRRELKRLKESVSKEDR